MCENSVALGKKQIIKFPFINMVTTVLSILTRFRNYNHTRIQLSQEVPKIIHDQMVLLLINRVALSIPLTYSHPDAAWERVCHKTKKNNTK